ncbi:MAG: primosomal protein N' [Clostridia bacterium]|nr:primosomal protein N' [Clostridia bacterium]
MRKFLVAQVYVEQTTISFDKAFDYLIPFDMSENVFIGQRVTVPFGRANKKRQGIIADIIERDESDVEVIKPIVSLIDTSPVITDEMMKLAAFIKEQTFCTFFEAIKPALPAGISVKIIASYKINEKCGDSADDLTEDEKQIVLYLKNSGATVKRDRLLEIMGLKPDSDLPDSLVKKGYLVRTDDAVRKVGDASVKMVRLCDDEQFLSEVYSKLSPKQRVVVDFLTECQSASIKEVCYFTGVTAAVVTALVKKEVVVQFENEVYRSPYTSVSAGERTEILLTDEQNAAYEGLCKQMNNADKGETALLYGVTGSGKTQVFLKLIDDVIDSGKGVILMVPEIALTPQTMSIFQNRYGSKVAVFHSAMSLGQRTDEYKRVKKGEAKIAIGTRSAVFAPVQNLGLIIMDEEQEHTYKSESTPRFHARDVARFRCAYNKCLFLMASATPSVETFSKAKSGQFPMYVMQNRYGNVHLPLVETVNMRQQYSKGNFSILSNRLIDALSDTFHSKKQSILLLNRRGYHVFVTCRSCGHVKTCPNCSISLTYHTANNRLMCHYCGYSEEFTDKCSECGEKQIKLSGVGTQKIEEELKELFPDARVLRMDADTTMTRFSHEKKLNAFANGEYDIMIGTQMVAKGLNFPNVTLVGVINADQSLYSDDFRSSEKTFSLLTQVIGRSGRGKDEGIAIVQTVTPENAIIELAAKQNYDEFYDTEILARKLMIYPPYCDLIVVGFMGEAKQVVKNTADEFFSEIKYMLENKYKDLRLIILGPSPCSVPKISNKYRYRLILKCKNSARVRKMLADLLVKSGKNKSVTVFADINPENII